LNIRRVSEKDSTNWWLGKYELDEDGENVVIITA
jgi:hypothetical protein